MGTIRPDEVAEVLCERRHQPVIEAAGRDRLVGCRVVAASEASECSAIAYAEAEHECPDEGGNLELAVTFDHAERSATPSSSEGNSAGSRRIIRDEEILVDPAAASSFLSKRWPDKPPLSRGSPLI